MLAGQHPPFSTAVHLCPSTSSRFHVSAGDIPFPFFPFPFPASLASFLIVHRNGTAS